LFLVVINRQGKRQVSRTGRPAQWPVHTVERAPSEFPAAIPVLSGLDQATVPRIEEPTTMKNESEFLFFSLLVIIAALIVLSTAG
jgi:hypothetical protein